MESTVIISGIAILGIFVLYIGMMNLVFARKRSQKEQVRRRMDRLRAAMERPTISASSATTACLPCRGCTVFFPRRNGHAGGIPCVNRRRWT